MSLRLVLAASAAIALAAPAFAQEAPAAPPAAESATESGLPPEIQAEIEAKGEAFEAKGEAFEAVMNTMGQEMEAAVTAAGGDRAKAETDLTAIAAKYQPQADAFAGELEAFFAEIVPLVPAEQRAQLAQAGPAASAQIRTIPAQAKEAALQAAAGAQPAPAAPQ